MIFQNYLTNHRIIYPMPSICCCFGMITLELGILIFIVGVMMMMKERNGKDRIPSDGGGFQWFGSVFISDFVMKSNYL